MYNINKHHMFNVECSFSPLKIVLYIVLMPCDRSTMPAEEGIETCQVEQRGQGPPASTTTWPSWPSPWAHLFGQLLSLLLAAQPAFLGLLSCCCPQLLLLQILA